MTDEIRLELKRQLLAAVPDIEARTVAGIVDIYAINLGRALPHIIEIACRLRGYRSSVIEHRVMIAGAVVPDDLVGLFPNELMAIDRT
jgi:hypothetical protein